MNEKRPPLWTANYLKAWAANFMLNFAFMIITPLLPLYLSEQFAADKHTIGLVLSGYTLTALLSRSVSGYLVDRFARKAVLMTGWLIFSLLFAGYFLTSSLLIFAIVRTAHGFPFGTATVSNSTCAIDILHRDRRAEGIGLYGLSNNLSTAIAPTIGLSIYSLTHSYDLIFLTALLTALLGVLVNATIHLPQRPPTEKGIPLSFDRFFLREAWTQGISMACFSMAYGVLATYLAIYGKEELGMTNGTGLFFTLLSLGLVSSRLMGNRSLARGKIVENASLGVVISIFGYTLFAAIHAPWAYYASAVIIGLGNGLMFPAFNNMFVNMAPASKRGTANSTLLTAWDVGMGMGIVFGGMMAENYGYGHAFWLAAGAHITGVLLFFAYGKNHYIRKRLTAH